jgi:hypothetical protein
MESCPSFTLQWQGNPHQYTDRSKNIFLLLILALIFLLSVLSRVIIQRLSCSTHYTEISELNYNLTEESGLSCNSCFFLWFLNDTVSMNRLKSYIQRVLSLGTSDCSLFKLLQRTGNICNQSLDQASNPGPPRYKPEMTATATALFCI